MKEQRIFDGHLFSEVLLDRTETIKRDIQNTPLSSFTEQAEALLLKDFISKYCINILVLMESQKIINDPKEIEIKPKYDPRAYTGSLGTSKGKMIAIKVPFLGDKSILRTSIDEFTLTNVAGYLDEGHVCIDIILASNEPIEQVKRVYDSWISKVNACIKEANKMIDSYNETTLRNEVSKAVRHRVTQALQSELEKAKLKELFS